VRVKTFTKWKAKTITSLAELCLKRATDDNVVQALRTLMRKVRYAKRRDLPGLIFLFHTAAEETGVKELLKLVPSEEEIDNITAG